MKRFFLGMTLFALLESTPVFALNELKEFYRGVRAQAMGNAFTAIADDEDAVFYNPAGISYNSGVELRLLNPKIDISADDLKVANDMKKVASSGFDGDAVKALFGKNIYLNGTVFPSILLPHFTFGYYASFNAHALMNNLSLPRVDLDYYYDRGFIGGTGFESRGFGRNHYFRYGLTLKVLTRRGVDKTIPITTLVTNNSAFLKSIVSGEGTGYGLDLGFQYDIPLNHSWDLTLGTAWHDIGNTRFGTRLASNVPPPIKSNLAMGAATTYKISKRPGYDVKVALEGRHLEYTKEDPRKKVHFGTELRLGDLAFQAGLSQLNWTAGASIDLWLLQIAAATYAVENMPLYGMNTERRYMVQVTLKLDASGTKSKGNVDLERRKRPRLYK